MSLSNSLAISASGLTAERLRLDVISNNIANVNTTKGPDGKPYRRQEVIFAARNSGSAFQSLLNSASGNAQSSGAGVEVAQIRSDNGPFKRIYDAHNPAADKDGYVDMPNIEPVIEMVDMISASRAYEAGVTAINAAKQMEARALDIGRG